MNLLGMGPGELLLIAMLGLIVFGPGKLPEIASQVGRAVRDLRRSTSEMTQEFQEAMRPLNEVAEFPKEISGAVGAAATMAQQGLAGQEPVSSGQEAAPAATIAPPTADTSEWHWEGSDSAANAQPVATSTAGSFWDWEAPEPIPVPSVAAPPAEPEPAVANANGSVWQWDEAHAAPPQEPAAAPAPSVDAAPVAALNGTAPRRKTTRKARSSQEDAEPEADVALVGESAATAGASRPRRRKKADPVEESA